MTFLVVTSDAETGDRIQEALEGDAHSCLTARDVDEAALTVGLARVDAVALDLTDDSHRAIAWLTELSLAGSPLAKRFLLLARPPVPDRLRMRASACGARVIEYPVEIDDLLTALHERTGKPRRGERAAGRRSETRAFRTKDDPDPEPGH